MIEVPGLFRHRAEEGEPSGLQPFSYDETSKVFLVGETVIDLVQFDTPTFPYIYEGDKDGIPVEEMLNYPAFIPVGTILVNIIGGPKLHNWIAANPDKVRDAHKVMVDAFSAFLDEPLGESLTREDVHGSSGFRITAGQNGGLDLQVAGDCACSGPDLYSHHIRGQFENGFAEYDLHNADIQAQRASLYAGIGHLSRLAEAG